MGIWPEIIVGCVRVIPAVDLHLQYLCFGATREFAIKQIMMLNAKPWARTRNKHTL